MSRSSHSRRNPVTRARSQANGPAHAKTSRPWGARARTVASVVGTLVTLARFIMDLR
jgi:hypothetical protein